MQKERFDLFRVKKHVVIDKTKVLLALTSCDLKPNSTSHVFRLIQKRHTVIKNIYPTADATFRIIVANDNLGHECALQCAAHDGLDIFRSFVVEEHDGEFLLAGDF